MVSCHRHRELKAASFQKRNILFVYVIFGSSLNFVFELQDLSVHDMEAGQHLKTLLQIQLASDASAVRHLPFSLTTLTQESFKPSPHLAKWTTRIHALLHSKDSGARWAGLCLAYKTSILSQNLMIEAAQSYLGVALPLLSVRVTIQLS